VAVGPDDAPVVVGYFTDACDFGDGSTPSNGKRDLYIAKYQVDGALDWVRTFGAEENDYARAVDVDQSGNAFITGEFRKAVDFGGGPMTGDRTNGEHYLVKLSPAGGHLWSKSFGDSGANFGRGVAADSAGGVVTSGFFVCYVNFGAGRTRSAGSFDILLVRFAP